MRFTLGFFLAFLIALPVFAERVKGPVNPKEGGNTIIVEKIVEVPIQVNNEINISISACAELYRLKTITYCADAKGCKDLSSIEVLMTIDPMISVECRSLSQNSKLDAVSAGIAVHARCIAKGGFFDLNKELCGFTVELRHGKKVKETASVWEGIEYGCDDELFPMAARNRRNVMISGGVIGGLAGAAGGGLLYQRYFGFYHDLRAVLEKDPCKVSKDKSRDLAEKLKKDEFKTWQSFIDALTQAGVVDPEKCADYFYTQAYLENVYKEIEKHFVVVETTEKYISLSILDAETYFEYNKSGLTVLTPSATGELDKLYAVLTNQGLETCVKFNIVGRSSSDGYEAYNYNLGMRRATAVADYLVDKGINASQITKDSEGEEEASSGKDRSRHRRADISLDFSSCPGSTTIGNETLDHENTDYVVNGDMNLDENKFYTKKNFAIGAGIGAPVGALAGVGVGALLTKYKCYLMGRDDLLAKWKDKFKIIP